MKNHQRAQLHWHALARIHSPSIFCFECGGRWRDLIEKSSAVHVQFATIFPVIKFAEKNILKFVSRWSSIASVFIENLNRINFSQNKKAQFEWIITFDFLKKEFSSKNQLSPVKWNHFRPLSARFILFVRRYFHFYDKSIAIRQHAYPSQFTEFVDIGRGRCHQNPGRIPRLSCAKTIERESKFQPKSNHQCIIASSSEQCAAE